MYYMYVYMYMYVGPPSFQSPVRVEIDNFQTENISVTLTWDVQNATLIDGYRISVNSTTQPAVDTTIALEGQYNIPLLINITAINCAGISEELVVVNEGTYMCIHTYSSMYMYIHELEIIIG